jgi:hypothetical protein
MARGFLVILAQLTISLQRSPVMAFSCPFVFPYETQEKPFVLMKLPNRSVSAQAIWSALRSMPMAPILSWMLDSVFCRAVETNTFQLFASLLKRLQQIKNVLHGLAKRRIVAK